MYKIINQKPFLDILSSEKECVLHQSLQDEVQEILERSLLSVESVDLSNEALARAVLGSANDLFEKYKIVSKTKLLNNRVWEALEALHVYIGYKYMQLRFPYLKDDEDFMCIYLNRKEIFERQQLKYNTYKILDSLKSSNEVLEGAMVIGLLDQIQRLLLWDCSLEEIFCTLTEKGEYVGPKAWLLNGLTVTFLNHEDLLAAGRLDFSKIGSVLDIPVELLSKLVLKVE